MIIDTAGNIIYEPIQMKNLSKITLGEIMSCGDLIIERNAMSIFKQLKKLNKNAIMSDRKKVEKNKKNNNE